MIQSSIFNYAQVDEKKVKPIFDFLQSQVCSIIPGYKGNPNGSFLKNMIDALLSDPPDISRALLLVAHALANVLLVLSKVHINIIWAH